jgi:ribosomal protein S18 acetylase RimI-like enzyme
MVQQMGVSIRVAGDSDLPFLFEADRHLSRQDLTHLVSLERVMVADVDGTAAGCLRWGLLWDEVPFMNLLWVVPERRGQGVGSALVTAWETSQFDHGHTLVLTSTVSAESAQHFYRRLGYVDSGSLLLPDEPAELFFRKSLAK